MNTLSNRKPDAVLRDHLDKAKQGLVEDDIEQNHAEDVVLLTGYGMHEGHKGVRFLVRLLEEQLPEAHFQYNTI